MPSWPAIHRRSWSCAWTSNFTPWSGVPHPGLNNSDERGLQRSGHEGIARRDDHVDFRANAKILEIDTGLDRKAGSGQQPAVVMRFVIVHIDAVAVHRFAETVA